MEQEIQRRPHHELQLLPSLARQLRPSWPVAPDQKQSHLSSTSLDLQLSISLTRSPVLQAPKTTPPTKKRSNYTMGNGEAAEDIQTESMVKWEASEQIRLAGMEKAYAERLRALARKEMELAQNELARANHVWERAREEVGRAESLKARSVVAEEAAGDGGMCMEITCHCCRQRFLRPASGN